MAVVWLQVPSLEKVLEFKAHAGEIEDLALGPDGKVRRRAGGKRWLYCLFCQWIS